jgi:hypothetical protein
MLMRFSVSLLPVTIQHQLTGIQRPSNGGLPPRSWNNRPGKQTALYDIVGIHHIGRLGLDVSHWGPMRALECSKVKSAHVAQNTVVDPIPRQQIQRDGTVKAQVFTSIRSYLRDTADTFVRCQSIRAVRGQGQQEDRILFPCQPIGRG